MSQESHDDSSIAASSKIPLPGTTPKERLSLLQWLWVAVFVMTVLALIWAHSPARIRLIGLFSLAFGLAGGCILGATTRFLEKPVSRNVVLLSFVLIALGEVGWTLESYRIRVGQLRQDYEQDVPQLITPEFFKQARHEELAKRARFPVYLQQRVAPLVQGATPIPELFWGCEILLGSLAGAWITRHVIRVADRLDEGESLR